MVSFMVEKRHSPEAASRYQLAGLWGGPSLLPPPSPILTFPRLGIALGRVTLAFVGRKMGEKMFAVLLLALASACLGVVWAVKNVPINAVALVLVGFFIGSVPSSLTVTGADRRFAGLSHPKSFRPFRHAFRRRSNPRS